MPKDKLEIVCFESASKDRDRWCSSNIHTAGSSILMARHIERRVIQYSYGINAVRVVCRRLKILAHVEKILFVMQNLRYAGSSDSRSLYVNVATL